MDDARLLRQMDVQFGRLRLRVGQRFVQAMRCGREGADQGERGLQAQAGRTQTVDHAEGVQPGGVQAEPWHYSFAPVAEPARRALGLGTLRQALADAPLLGKECVLARLEELHSRFVARIDLM